MAALRCRAGAGPVLAKGVEAMTVTFGKNEQGVIEVERGWVFVRLGRREWCIERHPVTGRWAALKGGW